MSLARVGRRAHRHHQLRPLPLFPPPRPDGPGTEGRPPSPSRRRACDLARPHRAPCQTRRRHQCRPSRHSRSRRQVQSVLPCALRLRAIPRCTSQTSIIHRRWRLQPSPNAPGGHAKQLLCAAFIELRLSAVLPSARARSRHNRDSFMNAHPHHRCSMRTPSTSLCRCLAASLLTRRLHTAGDDSSSVYGFANVFSGVALSPSSLRHRCFLTPDTQSDRGTTTRLHLD